MESAPTYLIIGHVSRDRTPEGDRPGGTSVYAGLTACAYGVRVDLVTSSGEDYDFSPLAGITVHNRPSASTTVFENRYRGGRRKQWIRSLADPIGAEQIPASLQAAEIVHLAPIAGESGAEILRMFPQALRCLTLQGMIRELLPDGAVRQRIGAEAEAALDAASAAVFSMDDVGGDEAEAARLASRCPITAITAAEDGCRLHWNGRVRHIPAPRMRAVDPTGAGDIFAAVFFLRLYESGNPQEAARMATAVASRSVSRKGLAGIPGNGEILSEKQG